MWIFGQPNVARMEARGDVEGLIKALRHKVGSRDSQAWEDTRSSAAWSLGTVGDRRAIEPLVAALRDESARVRGCAAHALGEIADPQSVEPIIAALMDEDGRVREWAAEALGRIGGERAVEAAIALLGHKDVGVRKEAAAALARLRDPRAVGPLIGILREDSSARGNAIWALKAIGAAAVEPLIAALKDEEYWVPVNAARALGEIGDPRAVAPLVAALDDATRLLGEAAANALDRLGWQPGADERGGRYWIAKGEWDHCVEIGQPAVEPLIAVLSVQTNSRNYVAAARALGKIGDRRAVKPLVALLGNGDTSVRVAAAEALDGLDWQPTNDALGARYWIGKRKWDHCVEIGGPAVEPLIASLGDLTHDMDSMQEGAIRVLGRIGDRRAVESLIAVLDGRAHATFAVAAAEVLAQLGDARAVQPLIAHATSSEAWPIRRACAQALVAMYRGDSLDDASKQRILEQRRSIFGRHHDSQEGITCAPFHHDEGTGVVFTESV